MSAHCCSHEARFEGVSPAYKRVLWAVILINAAMFLVEVTAGVAARSQALKADALDFLGDSATYALSLFVIGRPLLWRSRAALLKGFSLAAFGVWVLASTAYEVLVVGVPAAAVMSAVGVLALAANVTSALLLMRWRDGDANVRSVWLCSRNDAIGNVAVVLAAGAVWLTGTGWPDLLVAAILASLFLTSAVRITRQAWREQGEAVAVGGARA
jgi:Co/Zn/Cd efflux system component